MRGFIAILALTLMAHAATWTGALVDADCYAGMERNKNATTTLEDVNRDRDFEIRYCRPTAKTKSFTVVDRNGQSIRLDAAANAEVSAIVRTTPKRSRVEVKVTGNVEKKTLKVSSIAVAH